MALCRNEDGNRSWEDVAELAQQHSDQRWSSVWKAGMQVRVVDDELEPEIRCAGWMAVKDDIASVDILAHAVAESELDDGLAMEEPARLGRIQSSITCCNSGSTGTKGMKT